MKFDHAVNHNGVYYKAGEEVPIEEKATPAPEEEEPIDEEIDEETEFPKRRRRLRKE